MSDIQSSIHTNVAGKNIRNFSIIAHIDHGKSTLADRLLEYTGTIEKRNMKEQVLDRMDLERERGITIKMTPVRMNYAHKGTQYVVNLIDTPGHIDFAYEVSRAMKAVEGAVLLVDATQGVEAQTLSVLAVAREQGLVIIPALSKVDAPHARVDDVRLEVASVLNCDPMDILLTSGKTGAGIPELLEAILTKVPPPNIERTTGPARALVFDYEYSSHRGVVIYARMMEGQLKAGESLEFYAAQAGFLAGEVGVFVPDQRATGVLSAGEIGYITTGIKAPRVASVGDTVVTKYSGLVGLPGYESPAPVIWASVYPENQDSSRGSDDVNALRAGLDKLSLSDSSLSYEEESSGVLGRGFRCGFLGMLHLEIVIERLKREFDLVLIVTPPSITYEITYPGKEPEIVYTPMKFPEHGTTARVREPWVLAQIVLPEQYVGGVMELMFNHEAELTASDQLSDGRIRMSVSMPLRELMRNFFDKLKSVSSGYASVSYRLADWRDAYVVKLEVLLAEDVIPSLSRIVAERRIEQDGREIVSKLKELLPPHQFTVKIQARAKGRIVASERLAALQKDVTDYLYGGDITRKMKLREKQKRGKKKLEELGRTLGRVRIPQHVFMNIVKSG
jgi:GTP-binding protein LepA